MSGNANPVLVRSTRSGIPEKIHRGAICLLGEGKEILFSAGDIRQRVFPRSAMKFFQVLPLLLTGAAEHFGFSDDEIALMCASHNAEEIHLQTTRSILEKAGIPESALACGPHSPLSTQAAERLIRAGENPASIHNNCSGKHAGFLALSKFLKAPLHDYLLPEHPVQVLVRKMVSELCGIGEEHLWPGIDGCSAPNYGMPLFNLALGFRNLAAPQALSDELSRACSRVTRAVTTYPYLVGGEKRYCSEMMTQCKGRVFGKLGADGVYALGFPELQAGCAIKIDDGSTGPQYAVAQALIEQLGLFSSKDIESLHAYCETEILNCNGIRTGFITLSPGLFSTLQLKK